MESFIRLQPAPTKISGAILVLATGYRPELTQKQTFMARLFIGTYLDKDSQASLGALPLLNKDLSKSWQTRIKWAKESKLHLTWLFLGNVEPDKIPALSQMLTTIVTTKQICTRELSLQALAYECLELWPGHGPTHNLVLTPREAATELLDFVKIVRRQLAIFTTDKIKQQAISPWRPHITLMRLADAKAIEKLPIVSTLTGSNTHRNPKGKELAATAISGLSKLLPLYHALKSVSIIESKEERGTHNYNVLQTYSLI